MPVYEFQCNLCRKVFTMFMKMAELGKKAVACPHCEKDDTRQVLSSFTAVTARKS